MSLQRPFLLAALLASSVSAQRVWVVAPQAGTGVDFTDIQAGVQAASDGDMILVRAGTYAGFQIAGKSLVIAGDGPGVVSLTIQGSIVITQIDATRSLTVRDIDVLGGFQTPLSVFGCQGSVTIEGCRLQAAFALGQLPGASISSSDNVTLIRCTVRGDSARSIEVGLRAIRSTLHLHGCTVTGSSPISAIMNGADGCYLADSHLHATGTIIQGGRGSSGSYVPPCAIPPGNGGDALYLDATSTATLLDSSLVPGPGGIAGTCPPGQPGQAITGAGAVTQFAGPSGTLNAPSPTRTGANWNVTIQGPPSYIAWFVLAVREFPLYLPDCHGTSHPDLFLPTVVIAHVVPTAGTLAFTLPVPTAIQPLGVPLVTQVAFTHASFGCFVGEPSHVLFLDARY